MKKLQSSLLSMFLVAILSAGCVGRTGKVGEPISQYYQTQLQSLKLGVTTPDDLQRAFTVTNEVRVASQNRVVGKPKVLVSLKEERVENGKQVQIWELPKGGNIDVAALLIWGYVAYNKDQFMTFRFEDGKLASFESQVIPDPVEVPVKPISKK
ncbi:MAG: hypothetical protein KGL39_54490 [Patescibacteria group bacterium]|nr:hypothetical protein [Patescibacteria group bacterium]